MSSLLNKKKTKGKRRFLRKNMTKAERALWMKLRASRLAGLRFRRQYGVQDYVIDFYCPQYRLAIEVIRDVHGYDRRIKFDRTRRRIVESLGIKILIYTNQQVLESTEEVLKDILSNLPPTPSFIRRGKVRNDSSIS